VNPSPLGDRSATSQPFTVSLTFFGDLVYFLKRSGIAPTTQRVLKERTSVKDVIEACGVPHPEIDFIIIDGAAANFSRVLKENTAIKVYPVGFTYEPFPSPPLQRRNITRFVADGHLGKLTRNLHLLGFDVTSPTPAEDQRLLEVMQQENRALLTRDRRLLMHAIVRDGFCPRSPYPAEQTVEVVRRFQLSNFISPFSRCLRCNGPLQDVDKADVMKNLEPLTRIYYERFRRCQECGKIYWRGSHFDKLSARIEGFRAQLA
jgi:uncharacterized protein with PIN domain